jgi:hypothetical protein
VNGRKTSTGLGFLSIVGEDEIDVRENPNAVFRCFGRSGFLYERKNGLYVPVLFSESLSEK